MVLQNNKSPGPDGWPIFVIKSVSESISVSISISFNQSLNSGILPPDWKCAKCNTHSQKGARNLACNYRPVSLTSVFSKIMESIVQDHILSHLSINNLISPINLALYQRGHVPHSYYSYWIILLII